MQLNQGEAQYDSDKMPIHLVCRIGFLPGFPHDFASRMHQILQSFIKNAHHFNNESKKLIILNKPKTGLHPFGVIQGGRPLCGGCKTSVGRKKAWKRACSSAKKPAKKAYAGNPDQWEKDLCKKKAGSTGKYSLILFRGSGGKIHIIPHDEMKWIKINRIDFLAMAKDGTTRSAQKG